MFDGFTLDTIDTAAGSLRVRHGGSGPAVLLLHGHPRTHMTWGKAADFLSSGYHVVCPDLPGFGRSYQPGDAPDSSNSSKRAKAHALVELMKRLGHESFFVAGHDRGSLTAFRMAMDHPACVRKLVIVDAIPVIEHLERADWTFARDWYHWFFFAQPEKPERAISADPLAWYDKLSPRLMGSEAYDDLLDVIRDPVVIHGMIEDYRAGLSIDHLHDSADRDAGRKVTCPMLCLWSLRDDLEKIYGDPVAIWRSWADDVRGFGIESGHHVAEENPYSLSRAMGEFFGAH
ncbi:alpha/beta fold hydrolase [Rhizobium leguminosarum]|uniref:alpha/beta fold hydrolase n=1 Tax=Rhizobium leguminosarum TaxID=384 RepID=UPI001C90A640|nr:alpha/beta hydrolase [Rhizobium leguminosarum]MBY2915781.1 alpha/beta hydrolase [Rhizobium leguminosarum]MBY2971016.1 alpha/beta hydrolase [Rhizobium leguminosarum]MBY2978419.1 alpha/beta hydrolase [Rhizobium leguminosarum]MBY3006970.1 alpha/beta hydrolase [Rhizobium leguminosarum]